MSARPINAIPPLRTTGNTHPYARAHGSVARNVQMMSNNHSNTILGIKDVVRVTPLEEEAETFILEALEHRDPLANNNNANNLEDGLLEQVPEGTEALFVEEEQVVGLTQQQNNHSTDTRRTGGASSSLRFLSSDHHHDKTTPTTKSVEDTLFGLTTALSAMQFFTDESSEQQQQQLEVLSDAP